MASETFTVGDLTAVVGDNAAGGDHRAGYNGLWSLTHRTEPTNLFVPSVAGFNLDDFIHEGIGALWPEALVTPGRHVEWILFEERAEGGDMLTAMRRANPALVNGFTRVCEGGGVALYRRTQQSD